jgi:hypothetical protein
MFVQPPTDTGSSILYYSKLWRVDIYTHTLLNITADHGWNIFHDLMVKIVRKCTKTNDLGGISVIISIVSMQYQASAKHS